jgi:hypothetical protein
MATLPAIAPISNEDLTTKVVNGTGIFDELMTAAHAHLDQEWGKQRITGTQYAEVYLGQMTAVLQQSVAFLVQRDAIYLNNLLTQAQIDKANKELALLDKQIELIEAQIASQEANNTLIAQKVKTEKAQIQDTVDGEAVVGVTGAQTALYKQQKEGFIRDAEQKALKIISDTWITRKTVDDGTPLPTGFDTGAVDAFTRKVADGVEVTY